MPGDSAVIPRPGRARELLTKAGRRLTVPEWAFVFSEPLGLFLGGDTEAMSPRAEPIGALVSRAAKVVEDDADVYVAAAADDHYN